MFDGMPLSDTMAKQPKEAPLTIAMKVFVLIGAFFNFSRTIKRWPRWGGGELPDGMAG
jgi:hypothetical protein